VSDFVKQILNQQYDADVVMVRAFLEKVCHSFVQLVHQMVDYQKLGSASVEILYVRQSPAKDDVGVSNKRALIFSVTIRYLVWRGSIE